MTETSDLYQLTAPVADEELDAALLDMTGDVDKARVLHSTLAGWMVKTPSNTLGALEQAHLDSEEPRRRLKARLSHLKPLDEFCADKLQAFLAAHGHSGLDVRHDFLQQPRSVAVGVAPFVTGIPVKQISLEQCSLLRAAMQNFSAGEAQSDGLPDTAMIIRGADKTVVSGLTAQQFVSYCRALNLGEAYQAHVRDALHLPEPGEPPMNLSFNPAALDVGDSKRIDLQIDLHIALAKHHISEATHARLLRLIKADQPGSLAAGEKNLIWQGLNLDEACLWSVLVFSEDKPGELVADNPIIYMPNEPVRPWYEYPSLADFKQYLTLKLQVASYRPLFTRYLDESERVGFFSRFDKTHTLGVFEAVPVTCTLSESFYLACVGKVQLDAQVLAVPVKSVDEAARQQRWLEYLEAGLDLLNLASFVVPVVGQLMIGVAVGQLLGEVFEGVEDWTHHHHTQALKHLITVVENIAAMMLFAAGGRVVGSLKRSMTATAPFFEQAEAVTLQDHRSRLWMPRLAPYRQPAELPEPWVSNKRGVHQAHGKSYVQMDGDFYSIVFDPGIGQWRVEHPLRPMAYRPPLMHNYQGGWQPIFERPQDWTDTGYALQRVDPALADVSPQALQEVAAINAMELGDLQRLASEHQALPERFQDAVARFRQHSKVLDLIHALEQPSPLEPATARAQMLALPLMPDWPQGRFFELLDVQGNLLESHPDLAPFDYEDQSIHITEQQLRDGKVLSVALDALTEPERSTLLGEGAETEDAQVLLKRRLLATVKQQHRALYRKLYADYDGVPRGELAPLCARHPRLPRRVAWELVCDATTAERRYLRKTGRVPLGLEQRTREALDRLAEDHALTGLYWPPVAGASTRRLMFSLLARLAHWPRNLLLQVREQSMNGALLEQVGPQTATVRRTIVRTEQGFQAFDDEGTDLNTEVNGHDGLLQAVVDCLSPTQRRALGLEGDEPVARLRSQLRIKSQDERSRVAEYVWPERAPEQEALSACVQAQIQALAEPVAVAPALIRKLRKLYPEMSRADMQGFLHAAGVDHLSQARAVEAREQEFKALQQALKRWRSSRADHRAQVEPLWDHRLSRYQARKMIERCWRGVSPFKAPGKLEMPSLVLDGMLLGGLPTLPPHVRFDHVQQLSLRNMELNDEVGYFLKHFNGVRTLELADNQISRLPQALSQMPALEHLNLARNRLQLTEHTRAKLADMHRLKTLNLASNPLLDPPDTTHQHALRELILRDCRLKGFPAGAQHLPRLEHLDLRDNEIDTLPDWLVELPRGSAKAFNLRHNPLSASSRLALGEYRERVGVGLGFLEDDISRLNEQAAREIWLADQGVAHYAEKDFAWTGLKNEPGSDGLFKLLAELKNTADLKHVREDLSRRVWRVLEATAADAELREEVFQRAATPNNCDDAASANFSNLEIAVEIHETSRQIAGGRLTARPLLKLAKGLFRLDRLERIAHRHSLEHPSADPLEVSLAFRTGLAKDVYLPGQPKYMRFETLAEVTPTALSNAESELKTAELSPDVLTYIVDLQFWKDYLRRTFATRFEALTTPFDRRINAVFERRLSLSDADYHRQMNAIRDEQVQAETREVESLTHNALRLDDLHLCEAPVG